MRDGQCYWDTERKRCSVIKDSCKSIQDEFMCSRHTDKSGKMLCSWNTFCLGSCSVCTNCIRDVAREAEKLGENTKTSTKAQVTL